MTAAIHPRLEVGEEQVDAKVLELLTVSSVPMGFGELEKKVEAEIPAIEGSAQVRQAAWRLIRSKRAELTSDSKIKSPRD